MSHVARRLRPYLFTALRCPHNTRGFTRPPAKLSSCAERDVTHDYEKRVAELQAQHPLSDFYPRLSSAHHERSMAVRELLEQCERLEPGHTDSSQLLNLAGRVHAVRTAGSKLFFIDLKESTVLGHHIIQVVGDLGRLTDTSRETFRRFLKTVRKGDWCTVTGQVHKTSRGEPSIMAATLPEMVAPSLHQIPSTLDDPETRARLPHANMLVNPKAVQVLRVAHLIDDELRKFFSNQGFTGVRTPLLNAGAGGAIARPFETEATELEGQKLNLRIAPELYLKRLVVGGMSKVFEIGPAFRNEGVDATHNPEFTICEFYEAFATLDRLMDKTQVLLNRISLRVKKELCSDVPEISHLSLNKKFTRLDFIPSVEKALGHPLPDLSSPDDAQAQLLDLFSVKDIPIPVKPTLPRLLDALAAHYLEPLCEAPTFIVHHPAALSPLSKHFICPQTGQTVAARAELFIRGCEYANMYEEENSPFEQRRKFEEQLKYRQVDGESDGRAEVDDSYLEALEWGLPPTGGWGCGVDRLVMLLAGQERIADVLPFGSLRNVVGMAKKR